jgi:hypothetical protein
MFTEQEIRTLSAGQDALGWLEIPHGCPQRFVEQICETRARKLGQRSAITPAAPRQQNDLEIDAVRDRLRAVSI